MLLFYLHNVHILLLIDQVALSYFNLILFFYKLFYLLEKLYKSRFSSIYFMVKVDVELIREKKKLTVSVKDIDDLFKQLNVNPTTVLIIRNNVLVNVDVKLKDKDSLKLYPVISGG